MSSPTPKTQPHFHWYSFDQLRRSERYALMTATIIPRPIAIISTLNENKSVNLAAFSYFNAVSSDPALLMFSLTSKRAPQATPTDSVQFVKKDTQINIERTKEFVVHIASTTHVELVEKSGANLPYNVSELEGVDGIQFASCQHLSTPRILNFKVAFECVLENMVELGGQNTAVFGKILGAHIHESVDSNDGSLQFDSFAIDPLVRLARDYAALKPLV